MKKLLVITACSIFVNMSSAQTLNLPSNADNVWYSVSDPITFVNAACLGYQSGGSYNYIRGSIYTDTTTNLRYYMYFKDPHTSASTIQTTGAAHNVATEADMIIGNYTHIPGDICTTCTSTSTDYIAAAAFVKHSTLASAIYVDFFRLQDDPAGPTFAVSPSPMYETAISGYWPNKVHIDVVAAYSGSSAICSKFMITWDDVTTPANPMVYVAEGDLNTGIIGTPVAITTGGIYGSVPDVAGIQRFVSGSVDDIALVTFVDAGGNKLYYREYDFSTSTLSSLTTLDAGSTSTAIVAPRIDAIDNYNNNSSAGKANYAVVADAFHAGNGEIREYDNTTAGHNTPSSSINITTASGYSTFSPPYNNFIPGVSVGADGSGGYNYSIQHYMNYGVANRDIVFMEPYAYGSTGTLVGSNYYWVNDNCSPSPCTADGHDVHDANAVATAPNEDADNSRPTIYSWALFNASTNHAEVHSKESTSAYAFKHSQGSNIIINSATNLQVYPNPATNALYINASAGVQTQYTIIDLLGRELAQGEVIAADEPIDISKLPSGTYLLKTTGKDTEKKQAIFVKN